MREAGKLRRPAKTRFFVGCILRDAQEPLTSAEIADRLAKYRQTRRYLNNAGSISNLILGAHGIERNDRYPTTYKLKNWESFRTWIGLDKNKWRNIEKLDIHYPNQIGNKEKPKYRGGAQ